MDMRFFLNIDRISEVNGNVALKKEEVILNAYYIRNIIIRDEEIIIVYTMTNHENSGTVYQILKDKGKYENLEDEIKKVHLIRCYVSEKDYQNILEQLGKIG